MGKENTHTRLNVNEHLMFKANLSSLIRNEKLEGKTVMVVPVVLMVEGVHNDILYTQEELGKFAQAWNGRPVPIYHPQDPMTGDYISANSPDVLEKRCIGQLFNANFEDGKLKAEAWIDPDKANKIDKSVMTKLNNNEMLEVSTGLWFDAEEREGEWNGEKYVAIAYNFRPDHLAFLPEQVGACSIKDGAGAPRVNKEQKEDNNEMKGLKAKLSAIIDKVFKVNEMSHSDITSQLNAKIREKVCSNKNEYIWVRDVWENTCVFEKETTDSIKLFKISYTKDENDNILLSDDIAEVKEKVEYVPVMANQEENKEVETNNEKGEIVMIDRKEKVDALINNEKVDFAETDREFLEGLEDTQFDKIEKMILNQKEETATEEVSTEKETEETTTVNTEVPVVEDKPKTLQEAIADFPKEMQEMVVNGVNMVKEKKQSLIDSIVTANKDLFTAEELGSKEIPELEKLAKMSKVEADFSGVAGNTSSAISSSEKPMNVPDMVTLAQK